MGGALGAGEGAQGVGSGAEARMLSNNIKKGEPKQGRKLKLAAWNKGGSD